MSKRLEHYSVNERGCHEYLGYKMPNGYAQIASSASGKKKMWLGHRLAWTFARGPIPDGLCVMHKCDNPACINVEHLQLGTPRDNCHDMIRKGRGIWPGPRVSNKGSARPKAKLDERKVQLMRRLSAFTRKELAAIFGVSTSVVLDTLTRKTWKHV